VVCIWDLKAATQERAFDVTGSDALCDGGAEDVVDGLVNFGHSVDAEPHAVDTTLYYLDKH
jgi:hypothetical protein